MAKVNLISYAAAEKIAEDYLNNNNVSSVYVTTDGNVFYPHMKNHMKLHIRNNRLQDAWFFKKVGEIKVTKEAEPVKTGDNELPKTKQALIPLFEKMTDNGLIEKSEWENLKTAELRSKYEELTKK